MLEKMPLSLFREWRIIYEQDPFNEERADLRAAIIAATIANNNPYRKGPAAKPSDFMPYYQEPEQSMDEFLAIFNSMKSSHKKGKPA